MYNNHVMRDRFAVLLKVLMPPVTEAPTDLPQFLQMLPDPYLVPSPWTTWLFIVLCRYRHRQDWVEKVVRRFHPDAFPPLRELSEQEQPVTLSLRHTHFWPESIELECDCGFGRTLKDVNGDVLTFGITKKTQGIFFSEELDKGISGTSPPSVVERFQELHASPHSVRYAIDDLDAAGLLDHILFDEHQAGFGVAPDAYRLSNAVVWHMPEIDRFCQRWEDKQQRLWLAATIGDWPKAHELAVAAGATDILAITGPRAEFQRQERLQRAQRSIATGAPAEVDLRVVHDLELSVGQDCA